MADKPAPVEQVDRDAAADFLFDSGFVSSITAEHYRLGRYDSDVRWFIGLRQPLAARVAELEKRLEYDPEWGEDYDGIACRDDTIKMQDERWVRLAARVIELEAGIRRAIRLHEAGHYGHYSDPDDLRALLGDK